MGLNPFIALLIAIGVTLFILKLARYSFEKMMKEIEKESETSHPPDNSEKIVKNEFVEITTKDVTNEQVKTTKQKTQDKRKLISKISIAGMTLMLIYTITKELSTGLSSLEGILSFGFFCLCSWINNLSTGR